MTDGSRFGSRTKLILYAVGTGLFLTSLGYLTFRIAGQWQSLKSTRIDHPVWLAASLAIYAISHVTTGLAWPNTLRFLGERIKFRDGLKIGLVAQVGKYLPGNIAHYFGRAALGKSVGVSFRNSGLSTLVEIACALIAALILAPGVLVVGNRGQVFFPVGVGMFSLVAVTILIVYALRKGQRNQKLGSRSGFLLAALCIMISLFLSGASAYCLLMSISAPMPPLIYVTGSFALAWIAGFITPGAPGGLGVRETIFIGLLGPQTGAVAALACAILHRGATAAVDFGAALVGYAWLASGARSKM